MQVNQEDSVNLNAPTVVQVSEVTDDVSSYHAKRLADMEAEEASQANNITNTPEVNTPVAVPPVTEVVTPEVPDFIKQREAQLAEMQAQLEAERQQSQQILQDTLKAQQAILEAQRKLEEERVARLQAEEDARRVPVKSNKEIYKEAMQAGLDGDTELAIQLLDQINEDSITTPLQKKIAELENKLAQEEQFRLQATKQQQEQARINEYNSIYNKYANSHKDIFEDPELKEMLELKISKIANSGEVSTLEDLFSKATSQVTAFKNKYVPASVPTQTENEANLARYRAAAVTTSAQTAVTPSQGDDDVEDSLTIWRKARFGMSV